MDNTIRILGIIPARGGSKRIPRKNIVRIAGKPLIAHAIHAAKAAKTLDACIVSTDDAEIAALASSLGADVPFLRPKRYAHDRSRDIEYARHALAWLERHRGWQPEIVVFLPPDVVPRTGKDIDAVVTLLLHERLDSVRTFLGPMRHPSRKVLWTAKRSRKGLFEPLFPELVGKPMQEVPPYYLSSGLVNATRTRFIKNGTLWGKRVGGYVLDPLHRVEIDEPEDLVRAATLLKHRSRQRATRRRNAR